MNALVYLAAIGFALAVFPVHIYNYVFVDTGQKYASINAGVFKFNFFNVNTVKDKPRKMQINGSDKDIDIKNFKPSLAYKIFNSLCIYKIIQLGDYGVKNENNAFVALGQNAFTTAIYKFIQINGNYCKLRNYTVLNEEHSEVRYYAKAVTIINALVVAKILLILLMEKINEQN